jgi:hypothetical protein
MKILFYIAIHALLILTGLTAAFGFTLPKVKADRGATYSFGNQYNYDNAGSKWNHDRAYQHPGFQNHHNRWYYHYGRKRHDNYGKMRHRHYGKKRHHFGKYQYAPGLGYWKKTHPYSRYQYNPKNHIHRKHIHPRNRIPSHSFSQTRPLNPLNR